MSLYKRRRGWNYDPPPLAESTRSDKIRNGDVRRWSPFTRYVVAGIVTIPVAVVIIAACVVILPTIYPKRPPVPAVVETTDRPVPPREPVPSPGITPVPTIHNSPDTECESRRQCTDEEFEGVVDSLRRQWAITPESLRSKCAIYSTYPPLEHCILSETVSWFAKHPNGAAPWINPKNFDTGIMSLCQKDPKSLALCSKP